MDTHNDPPQAIILAGPNGAGKSTAAPVLLRDELRVATFVNADVIAQGLSGFAPESVDRQAGVILLQRLRELQARRESFAFESTLAGRGHAGRIRSLTEDGYEVHLFYIWLPSADHAVARVRLRVRHGGHDIPESTIRRRYERSLRNLADLYVPLVSTWRVYDGRGFPRSLGIPLVAKGRAGQTTHVRDRHTWNEVRRNLRSMQGRESMSNRFLKEALEEGTRIDRAMDRAFFAAVRLHRMHGVPMALWKDGKTCYMDPHDIPLPEEEGDNEEPFRYGETRNRRRSASEPGRQQWPWSPFEGDR